jgi:hypothetical protein
VRLDGPQTQCGNGSKEKISLPVRKIEKSLHQVTTLVVNAGVACMTEIDVCKKFNWTEKIDGWAEESVGEDTSNAILRQHDGY